MSILDTHIALDIAVQKMDSNVFDNLKSEEKDWALNRAQLQFIRDYYNPMSDRFRKGFEDNQTVLDYLSPLVTTVQRTPYLKTGTPYQYVQFSLPNDYLNFVSAQTRIMYSACGPVDVGTQTNSTDFAILPFEPTLAYEREGIHDFSNFDISVNGNSRLTSEVIPRLPYYSFPDDAQNLTWDVDEHSNFIHWESFNNRYYPGSFIIEADSSVDVDLSIGSYQTIKKPSTNSFQFYSAKDGAGVWKPVRIGTNQSRGAALNHSFKNTQGESPLAFLNEYHFDLYYDGFEPLEVALCYIRKPKKPSYSLGIDLEISQSAQDLVVQKAANYLLHLFQSKLYKSGQNEYNQSL